MLKLVIGDRNYSSWSLRPWLALKQSGLPFEEIQIPLRQTTTKAEILNYSPSGKVPCLIDGETVVWREKDAARDIAQSTYATVVSATRDAVTLELADKRQLTLPSGDPMLRRLDLGYALNAHMAQGMTQAQAIEVISSTQRNLATQRTQNVLNTRATA